MNTKKTEVMYIKIPADLSITVDGKDLKYVE